MMTMMTKKNMLIVIVTVMLIDETEILEKLIAERLENDEDRDESDVDDDNT